MVNPSDERVKTHKWFRWQQRPPEPDLPVPDLKAFVPEGAPPAAALIADRTAQALAGWPILSLRLLGTMKGNQAFGSNPGKWARAHLGDVIDPFCICPGDRCRFDDCPAGQLMGRHATEGRPEGEAWAPLVVRANDMPTGKVSERTSLKMEVVLAGEQSINQAPMFIEALKDLPPPPPKAPVVSWSTVQALVLGDEGELRFRKVDMSGPPPLLHLERLAEPKVRRTRLTMTFLTATPLSRMGEEGRPTADLTLIVDRMTRSMGAWMGRTGHKGPRLPVDDLLRSAAAATISSDNSRVIEIPAGMMGAAGARDAASAGRVPALTGSITWKGEFTALAPLLRAAHHLGMGPGRQHGLGQIVIR
ncbi:MAG: hypothetical protein GY898_21060 [Proteobacteria bacterium]|nr:hypothetical protein [Pseudomonadota bacterium]